MNYKEIREGDELNEDCISCRWFVESECTEQGCRGCNKNYICTEWRRRDEI